MQWVAMKDELSDKDSFCQEESCGGWVEEEEDECEGGQDLSVWNVVKFQKDFKCTRQDIWSLQIDEDFSCALVALPMSAGGG